MSPKKIIWTWDKNLRRYRNSLGQFTGITKMLARRDQYTESVKGLTASLAEDVANGTISPSKWLDKMSDIVRGVFVDQYALGSGGRDQVSQSAWGSVGAMVKNQYRYLRRFAAQVAMGNMTAQQIAIRAAMYVDAGTTAFEKAVAATYQGLVLPEYPADGHQDCLSRCKCHWHIEDGGDSWICTWVLDLEAQHCDTCLGNSVKWRHLVVPKSSFPTRAAIRKALHLLS